MEHGRRESAGERSPRRSSQKHQSTNTQHKVRFVILTVLLIFVVTSVMIGAIFMIYVKTTLAPTLEVRAEDYVMNLSSHIYYEDKDTGEWVEYQTLYNVENRVWVDIEDMPDALWQAAVAIEDERFFRHNGVDWSRTISATVNMFIGMRDTYGGSTITQQLLKNMTKDNAGTVNRKVREIFRALEFEKNYTKKDILELYLNTIYLGKNCYGVQTAAEYYFGKEVSELTVAECASLIAITNNPYQYGPMNNLTITRDDGSTVTPRELNKERQQNILKKMSEVEGPTSLEDYSDKSTWTTFLSDEEYETAKAEELQFVDRSGSSENSNSRVNSWFVEQVFKDVSNDLAEELGITVESAQTRLYNGGYKIYTTLDPEIQEIAESVYEDRSNLNVTSSRGQKLQSAITIIEPSTGNIVAMVGAMEEKTANLVWNYAIGTRQVGSSIKPLTVYAPALDANVITMASTFDNYPVRLLNGSPWPKNSPPGYSGWTTLANGVANSINTVAVQVVEKLGVSESFAFATEKLGLSLVPEDMDVSPLGLGGLTYGLNTVEMAAAYASFANNGVYNSPRMYVRVTDANDEVVLENTGEQHVAMKETTAYFMNELLQGVVNGGTGGSARFSGMTIAGKTGTTSDNYDRYFVGYTPYYCAAVWTGYDDPERISYSGNPAITMWKKVMQQVHENLPNKSFDTPSSGLTQVTVCKDSGLRATDACYADPRQDRVHTVTVAAGTAPTEECNLHVLKEYCTEGNCLAGEYCPEESVELRGYLDYVREDYGASIVASDNAYLVSTLEKALAESRGCPVHTSAVPVDPDDGSGTEPIDPNDPDAPFIDDPEENPDGGNTGQEGDPSGGGGDTTGDWWNNLWNNSGTSAG